MFRIRFDLPIKARVASRLKLLHLPGRIINNSNIIVAVDKEVPLLAVEMVELFAQTEVCLDTTTWLFLELHYFQECLHTPVATVTIAWAIMLLVLHMSAKSLGWLNF